MAKAAGAGWQARLKCKSWVGSRLSLSEPPPLAPTRAAPRSLHGRTYQTADEYAHACAGHAGPARKRGVDSDQHPREPSLEEMRRKHPAADQGRQRDQRSRSHTEGSGAGIQPPRRPAQRKQEAAEAADGEKPVYSCEWPRWNRGAL
jgi:hypothetical protein